MKDTDFERVATEVCRVIWTRSLDQDESVASKDVGLIVKALRQVSEETKRDGRNSMEKTPEQIADDIWNVYYNSNKMANIHAMIITAIRLDREAMGLRIQELEASVKGIQQGGRNIQGEMIKKMNELESTNSKLRGELEAFRKAVVDSANSIDELKANCDDWENADAIAYGVKKYVIVEILKKVDALASKESEGGSENL